MVEREAEHRRETEKSALSLERAERRRGQYLGFLISIIALGVGGVVAVKAPSLAGQIVGGVIGAGGLVSLVIAFITGQSGRADEEPLEEHE